MKVNSELDQDGCLDIELIENSVAWQKEKGGDNILLQYINGGENMRIIERFSEDADITEAHHWGKSLAVKFSNGNFQSYFQDKMGNYRLIKDLGNNNARDDHGPVENRQKESEETKKYKKIVDASIVLMQSRNRIY